ncbi:hypothetical protein OEZ85_002951 [Tetradesmus obliquus]|uniref:Uncharacterized protein n=1 Tax=Tetradesmus obliquus TaxID=3088 RepID=A0ABY8TZ87_TETOB|nr:hypothetical protein OEZ85_002951 [Tetradesmus obliquus]
MSQVNYQQEMMLWSDQLDSQLTLQPIARYHDLNEVDRPMLRSPGHAAAGHGTKRKEGTSRAQGTSWPSGTSWPTWTSWPLSNPHHLG